MRRKEVKEDKLVEVVAGAVALVRKRRKQVLGIFIAIVVVVGAFLLINARVKRTEFLAVQLLGNGKSAFREGKFNDALALFEKVCKDYPGREVAGQALIYIAESFCHLGKLDEAEANLNKYLALYAGGEFSARAQQGLGYVMEQRGEFQKAIDVYRKVYENYPESHLGPQAILSTGCCFEAMGMWEQAKESYEKLISTYPWSHSIVFARAYLDVVEWEIKENLNKK